MLKSSSVLGHLHTYQKLCAALGLAGVIFTFFSFPSFYTVLPSYSIPHDEPVKGPVKGPAKEPPSLTVVSQCPASPKPNVILSATDGENPLHAIFMLMSSLEDALGKGLLDAQRTKQCPPAPVEVKIMVSQHTVDHKSPSFQAILDRYPNLELVGNLPENTGLIMAYVRHYGWLPWVQEHGKDYDRILLSDLDVVMQRNPFLAPMAEDIGLQVFTEWTGFKIGHCSAHQRWFDGCASNAYIPKDTSRKYTSSDRICAGNVLGRPQAMELYLQKMIEDLESSDYKCNDQALHIHNIYMGTYDAMLKAQSAGKIEVVNTEDGFIGTVGTTPYVRFNEWGELINDKGEVFALIHQFKYHPRITAMVEKKWAWQVKPGEKFPEVAVMVKDDAFAESNPHAIERVLLKNIKPKQCEHDDALCSCRFDDCQWGNYVEPWDWSFWD